MKPYTTTLSFRAAWRWGCPHLAGQPVLVTRSQLDPQAVDVSWRGVNIRRRLYVPQDIREPGGVQRRAERCYPPHRRQNARVAAKVDARAFVEGRR